MLFLTEKVITATILLKTKGTSTTSATHVLALNVPPLHQLKHTYCTEAYSIAAETAEYGNRDHRKNIVTLNIKSSIDR